MALSDREKKVLEELERELYASDSKFMRKVAPSAPKSTRAVVGGSALAVVGLSVIIFAVIVQTLWFGVLGFVLMLAGLVLASSNWMSSEPRPKSAPGAPRSPRTNLFEDRWDKRQGN